MDFNCKQSFIEVSLTDIRDAIYLAQHTVNSKVVDLLDQNKITITCYGSDARLDKWNRGESSIDLLVCNKSEIKNDELRELIKEFIEKSKDIIEDNSYSEIQSNGEIIQIYDEINVGREISQLQKNDYYIDILNFDEELYKYGNKTYPDRLIDAYNLTLNHELFWSFKEKMLSDIIEKPKILKDFRQDVKSYFKEETIRGKNIRKNYANHFDFDTGGDFGLLQYDIEDFFGFKHGPLRAMQYKIIEKFISFVIDRKDSSLIKFFPFSIEKRLKYFDENEIISGITNAEYLEIIDLYKFFRDKNDEINFMYLSGKNKNDFYFSREFRCFIFERQEYIDIKIKLDRFVELFKKLA